MKDGQLKLITLVTDLGEYLNSEDGATRSKSECAYRQVLDSANSKTAMSYLAEVLASTPQKVLTLQQRTFTPYFSHLARTH